MVYLCFPGKHLGRSKLYVTEDGHFLLQLAFCMLVLNVKFKSW
jgi:hypothetical protein